MPTPWYYTRGSNTRSRRRIAPIEDRYSEPANSVPFDIACQSSKRERRRLCVFPGLSLYGIVWLNEWKFDWRLSERK